MKRIGLSNRAIAREINCSPSTVGYELRRGTPEYSGRGRRPRYSAKRRAAVYRANRVRCRRPKRHLANSSFLRWAVEKITAHNWSFDTCVGRARLLKRFAGQQHSLHKNVV
ncbi:helix-turn-helix domain-containing protein [Caproicibacterium amylolyticum]|uniref:Helix-turn-helix domain-containing protein n=1 Tax=Caproicibacterium amylolyticum TaxID=2766537 RepID=A0A7G9WE01_9FIRM|nr:helix-turn-helix domain-containing protein [Caproicibacterium amylolyticum]